ncbi:MAG TPA: recombinase family protein [Noviherbaspirillum sp.]|nr:recombinase family protein [Noviherbaspirillum sp.]
MTFAYGRVRTADQQSASQRLEIEQAGYDIDDETWFADVVSGKVPAMQRRQFTVMLERMRKGERLVVTKLDRLGRDAIDIQATVRMLAARQIEVVVLQLGKVDLASSAGKMMLAMLAAVAEMERVLLVEPYKAGTSISSLARAYGISRASVLAIVKPMAS